MISIAWTLCTLSSLAALFIGIKAFFLNQRIQNLLINFARIEAEQKNTFAQNKETLAKAKKAKQQIRNLERAAQDSLKKQAELENKLNSVSNIEVKQKEQLTKDSDKQADELSHYKSQTEALTVQLKNSIEEKKIFKEELKEAGKEKLAELEKTKEQLSKKFKALKTSFQKQQKENELLNKRLIGQDRLLTVYSPVKYKKLYKQAKQHMFFFNMIKGQKELLEERNSNWELALKRLSLWTLEKLGSDTEAYEQEANLGALVGTALQKAGLGPLQSDGEDLQSITNSALTNPSQKEQTTNESTENTAIRIIANSEQNIEQANIQAFQNESSNAKEQQHDNLS